MCAVSVQDEFYVLCVCVCVCACVHVCAHVYVCPLCVHVCTHVYVCVCLHKPECFISLAFYQVRHLFTLRYLICIVHLDGLGQARMADASTVVYKCGSVVRCHHVYKTVWTPLIYEMLEVV